MSSLITDDEPILLIPSSQEVPDDKQSDSDNSWKSEEMKEPMSTDDESSQRSKFPQFNEAAKFGYVSLLLGMEFKSCETFKAAVKDYTINAGRPIDWDKNDKLRVRAKCQEKECKWEIFLSENKERRCYQVKTFNDEHTCCRTNRLPQADKKWVVHKLEAKLRDQPKITHTEVFDFFKKDFKVIIDRTMIYRALKEARELVEGSEREQYSKMWDYANELLRSNPGSLVKMDTIPQPDSGPQFQRFFVCLDACKRGFKAGCRPFIGLDGCFLKGYYGGQLLSAVGQDANKHIFVIAYAIVDVENKDNWKWFLTLLHGEIGDYVQHGWIFMSDMQKGLIQAVQEVMPDAPHRFCAMHLWRNFIKRFKEKELRGVVWECSKATTPAEFNMVMERVKRVNEKAWDYLNKWPKNAWTKAYFDEHCKVDNITNNTCEIFNSAILNYRGKPILTMAEEVRCYVMRTMSTNKLKLEGRSGPLCPVQQSRLDKEKIESNYWTPIWSGDTPYLRYQVENGSQKVDVDLSAYTCTCRFWQITGMPCKHACAAMAHKGYKPEDYCHAWLTIGAYRATYEFFVQPTQSDHYWTPTEYERPLPPKIIRKAGRPKKQRRKDGNEEPISGTKLKRRLPIWTCQRCGLEGHNSRGCTNQGVERGPKQSTRNVSTEEIQETQAEIRLTQSMPQSSQGVTEQASQGVTEQSTEGVNPSVQPPNKASRKGRGKRYGIRGHVVPSTLRMKEAPRRGPTPINPAMPSNQSPPPSSMMSTTQIPMMQFIPTPGLPQMRPRQP